MKKKRKTIKNACLHALMLTGVFYSIANAQNKTNVSKDNIKAETQTPSASNRPYSSVRVIRQDRKGNIWLVSLEGILRYDGKSFTNITNHLNARGFWDILEDKRGNFWLASAGSGVYYYDGKSFKNYTTKEGLPSNSVFKIYEDKAGIIWFGTGEGPSRYNGKSFTHFKLNDEPPPVRADSARSVYQKWFSTPERYWMINQTKNLVNAIGEDKNGNIWFGTWGDVGIYDGKTYTSLTAKYGKTFTKVRNIITDKKGNIWLNGGSGLLRYDGKNFTKVPQRGVGDIIQDKKGNVWTTGESNAQDGLWALSRYDAKSLYNQNPAISEVLSVPNGLFGILEARDGNIWVASSDGVYRYDGRNTQHFSGRSPELLPGSYFKPIK